MEIPPPRSLWVQEDPLGAAQWAKETVKRLSPSLQRPVPSVLSHSELLRPSAHAPQAQPLPAGARGVLPWPPSGHFTRSWAFT